MEKENTLLLELTMTESAFGHEYALMNLTDSVTYTQKQAILWELENYKKSYFSAREALNRIDPEKLSEVEENLRIQREFVLRENSTTIH